MRTLKFLTTLLSVIVSANVFAGELITFIEKPGLLNTGDAGEGRNIYRPRWSSDGKWLSFEAIDINALQIFITIPGSDFIYECRGRQKADYKGSLDLFGDSETGRSDITRLSWARQLFNNTSMYCFIEEGVLYKSFAFMAPDGPGISPPGPFIPIAKLGDVGKKNGLFLPELGYTPAKGQPPVIFTDNDSGKLYAITGTNNLVQMTFADADEVYSDYAAKFKPADNSAVVFVRAFEGNSDLFIINDVAYPGETAKPLLTWKKSDEITPTWSPDGEKIAFYSNRHEQGNSKKQWDLYLIHPAQGNEPILLVQNVRPDNIDEKISPPYMGPQWMGNDVILYVKDNKPQKDPLMYYQISTGRSEILPVGTIINDSPSLCDLGDGTYLLAYTTFGEASTDLDQPDITNKIYYAKLLFSE